MSLKLYNTLIRKEETFKPVKKDLERMYVCGPTVNDVPHLGHARQQITFDILRKYLLYLGYKVKFVSNVTDVDDKIINKANELGEEINKLTQRNLLAHLEDYSKSYQYYKQAIQLDSNNADGWYGAGVVLMVEENLQESLVFLKKAIKLDDSCADFWNAFGKVNAALDHYEDALIAFRKSIEIEDSNPEFWIALADFFYNYDQTDLAIQTLFRAERTLLDNVQLYYKLSGFLAENSNSQLAKIYLKKALTMNFSMHHEMLLDFPGLQSKRWVLNMIEKFK